MKFSVIVAARNEGLQIGSALKRLRRISRASPLEIILVDGRSEDDTARAARAWADQVLVLDRPNRGAQKDAGARKASGDLLFFLSPDSQPPDNWQQALEHFWLSAEARGAAASAFSVDYGSGLAFALAARAANARAAWRGLASSDHGLCTTPDLYRQAGGFPALDRGEDYVFCRRLRRLGRLELLKERIHPAGRGLRREGFLRWTLNRAWLELSLKIGPPREFLQAD